MSFTHSLYRTVVLLWLTLISVSVSAKQQTSIALIIDDVGYSYSICKQIIQLPEPITYSILPFSPHGKKLAEKAYAAEKEIMLHLPMQAELDKKYYEPSTLTSNMSENEFRNTFRKNFEPIPYAVGINNHMGSQLTRYFLQMGWLVDELIKTDLYLVDSKTTKHSILPEIADYHNISFAQRDVFLDHDRDPERIREQFKRLIKIAKRKGNALGIGHPYNETLSVLKEMLPTLAEQDIQIVSVSELIKQRKQNHQND